LGKITFVLPLKIFGNKFGSDLVRVKKILLPSIIKHFNLSQIDKFIIITLSAEHDEVSKELLDFQDDLNLNIITEEKVLKLIHGWNKHVNIHKILRPLKGLDVRFNRGKFFESIRLKYSWYNMSGWYKQQALKIYSAKMINTEYYMTLDADICLTQTTDMTTFFPAGKAIYTHNKMGIHYDWYLGSAKMLDIDLKFVKEDYVIGVTPEILSTRVVLYLIEYLKSKASEKKYFTLFEYLAANCCWTEYTLYWLFLHEYFLEKDYYTNENHIHKLESNYSIWFKDQANDKDILLKNIDNAFNDKIGLFLIIQSNCILLDEYCEIIRNYLK
jgi:Family of unknown function (DUF6492)